MTEPSTIRSGLMFGSTCRTQHVRLASSVSVGGLDEVEGKDLARRTDRDTSRDWHLPNDDRDGRGGVAGPQLGGENEGDQDARKRQPGVDEARQRTLNDAARAGDRKPDRGAEDHRDDRRHDAHIQGIPSPEHQLGDDVASSTIGAQRESGGTRARQTVRHVQVIRRVRSPHERHQCHEYEQRHERSTEVERDRPTT